MKRIVIALLILASGTAWADKAGFYLGVGITSSTYSSPDDDDFTDIFEDERSSGWRGELGYIWDLGKPGGFHLGVAGTYDNFGEVTREEHFGVEYAKVSFEAQAFSVLVVIEQELASWADFVFKVGPASVNYEFEASYLIFDPSFPFGPYGSESDSSTEIGGTMILGFTFFPTDFLAIELARQGTAFVDSQYDENNAYAAGTWSASLQYRF